MSEQAVFHDYVVDIKDEVFEDAADVLMSRLKNAAEAVGKALETALNELAQKVRVCPCSFFFCLISYRCRSR